MAIYNDVNLVIKVDPSREREEYMRRQYLKQLHQEISDEIVFEKWKYQQQVKKQLGRDNQGAYAIIPEIGEKVRSYDARNFFRQMRRDRYFWEDKLTREQFARDNPEVVCTR